jgi:hypothetical protein
MRSEKNRTGYKGVAANYGRFKSQCKTLPCLNNHLGSFNTMEAAAYAYLQHWEEKHPEELKEQGREHAHVSTDKGKKRKQQAQPMVEPECLSELDAESEDCKRCKQDSIEEWG